MRLQNLAVGFVKMSQIYTHRAKLGITRKFLMMQIDSVEIDIFVFWRLAELEVPQTSFFAEL